MPGSFQPFLETGYDRDFSVELRRFPDSTFASFRTLEMVVGASDRERFGLAKRRILRLLAPQTNENPIFFHLSSDNSAEFRAAVDQLAEVGFEMILYSFGSGFDIESRAKDFIPKLKADVDYARAKGIEVGSYDLIALTRRTPRKWAALRGNGSDSGSACFASGWNEHLLSIVSPSTFDSRAVNLNF